MSFLRVWGENGHPENCRRLLGQDVPVLVFPEGARGISKTYDKAYTLQDFGHGFMRLALETNTPIVPVGVVGAEEQYLTPWNLETVARRLGVPAFPLSLNFLVPFIGWMPLPVKYRIYFGTPMHFDGDPDEDETEVARKVGEVKAPSMVCWLGVSKKEGHFHEDCHHWDQRTLWALTGGAFTSPAHRRRFGPTTMPFRPQRRRSSSHRHSAQKM